MNYELNLAKFKNQNISHTHTHTHTLKVFEVFSGIGAQHRALLILKKVFGFDFQIVGTSEWDIDAILTYCSFHYPKFDLNKNVKIEKVNDFFKDINLSTNGKEKIDFLRFLKFDDVKKITLYNAYNKIKNQGDITKINGINLYNSIGSIDLITYSFPCQDLSIAGSLHGFNKGMKKGAQTRSSLLWEIERILLDLKKINKLPRFLLLENVSNILSKKHEPDFILWKKSLLKLGYKSKTFKFNAKDFNFPQNRNRVFSIAINSNFYLVDEKYEIINFFKEKNINEKEHILHFLNNFFNNEKLKKNYKFCNSLKNLIKQNYSNKEYFEEAFNCLIKNTPSRKKMIKENRILNEFDKYKYSRTLTTKQDRTPNAGIVFIKNKKTQDRFKKENYTNYRFLTPRETYLLMGFSEDDFNKIKNLNLKKEKMYQQAGNSIVVKVLLVVFYIIFNVHLE